MALTLISPAFADGQAIPRKYSRDGGNLLPPLRWSGAPEGTRSFLLVIEDPDAPSGTFRHLGVVVPADRDSLPESADTAPDLKSLKFAENDFGHARYDGPAPPIGHGLHHYHFRLAALDLPDLDIPETLGVADFWQATNGHRLAEAELVGVYER